MKGCSYLRAIEDEPVGFGVAEAVAEDDVESPEDLVDEVAVVHFEAAIVVAGEVDTRLVDEDPAREQDGLYATQEAVGEDVTRGVLDREEDEDDCPASEGAGLDAAVGAELIGDDSILKLVQGMDEGRGGARGYDRIAQLLHAELDEKEGEIEHNERRQEEEHQGDADAVREVLDLPVERRGFGRREGEASGGLLLFDEGAQVVPYLPWGCAG